MRSDKGRKVIYILISVLASILLWYNVSRDANVTLRIHDLPIAVEDEHDIMGQKGLMLVAEEEQTVDLVLQLPRNLVFSLDTSKIRLVADISSIEKAGKQPISYTIVYPNSNIARYITVESPNVRNVMVDVAEFSRKQVEIRCNVIGSLADGYSAGAIEIEPQTLELRGREEDLADISYAMVNLNIDKAKSSIVENLPYVLYNSEDKAIKSNAVYAVAEKILVKMPVNTVKELPITITFVESSGAKKSQVEYNISPKKIILSGDAKELEKMKELSLGSLAVEAVQSGDRYTYQIPIPENFVNLSGGTEAVVEIENCDLQYRDFTVSKFSYQHSNKDQTVTVLTNSLAVTLCGEEKVISKLSDSQLEAVADLTDVTGASGVYTVPAAIKTNAGNVGVVGSCQVTVRLSNGESDKKS